MKRATKEGLQVSVGLHLLALGVVLVLGLLATFFEEESPVVFELVDLNAVAASSEPVRRAVSENQPVLEPSPLPELEPLDVPTFDDLRPVPEIPPERVVEPPPSQVLEPTPGPPPQRLSYDQHLRTFGEPEVTPAASHTRRPEVNIEAPSRDWQERFERPSLTSDSSQLTAAQQDALDSYIDSLAARLKAAFNPLGTNGLVALIEFTVQADGSITPVRIKRSSGNEAFDRSVLSVFQRIRRYQPPPHGKAHKWEFNFRSEE